RFDGNGTARRRAAPLQPRRAGAEPDRAVSDRRAAGALSSGSEFYAVPAYRAGLGDEFFRAAAQLPAAAGRSPLRQFALGAGKALVLGRAVPGPARYAARTAVECAVALHRVRAHLLSDSDGAAADRRGRDLEADLHARHKSALLCRKSPQH